MTRRLAVLLLSLLAVPAQQPWAGGSTLIEVGSQRIRLADVTVPPRAALCGKPGGEWRCGRIAELTVQQRLLSGDVRCDSPAGSDAVACTAGAEDLSRWLLAAGWARALAGAPGSYVAAEREARAARRGIWREETGDWRLPAGGEAEPACDACAARHQRVTGSPE